MDDHTKTLVCRKTDRESHEKEWDDEQAPPARLSGHSEKNADDETHGHVSDAAVPYRANAGFVAITN